jgi:transposase-like protein
MQTGKRRGEAFWRDLVSEWEEGGEPVGIVAQRHGVTVASVYRWRKRLAPDAFIEITQPPRRGEVSLTLDWNGRVRVHVPSSLSEDQFAAVFAAAARI